MRIGFLGLVLITMLAVSGCNQKKSDVDLFKEGPVYVSVSADPIRGYEPLFVNFSAYIETRDSTFPVEVKEAKWLIRGPGGVEQEIIQESRNYQDDATNEEDFFYMEQYFRIPGKWRVQLVINNGEYKSNPKTITVWDKPDNTGGIR